LHIKMKSMMIGSKILSKKEFKKFIAILLFFCLMCVSSKKEPIKEVSYITQEIVLKRGENLEQVLLKYLDRPMMTEVIKLLKDGGFPFQKCFPNDSIKIVKKDGEFMSLEYIQSPTIIYYIKQNPILCIAMKFPYIDTVQSFLQGRINSTLYESILEVDGNANLVFRFADIFAWEIDFFTETQSGDSFYIFYKKTLCDSNFIDYADLFFVRYKGEIGDYYGIQFTDNEGCCDYYNLEGKSLRKSLLKSPIRYSYISSYFSKRRYHPILKIWRPHHGLDYVAPSGAPVSSIGDGIVTYKGRKGAYGNLVEIRHKNNFRTRYGHLSGFAKRLYKGKRVKMGELIGYVGTTGLSTGPHLHFEIHKNGVPINPLRVKIPRAPSVKKKYLGEFKQHCDSLLRFIEEFSQNRREERRLYADTSKGK